MSNVVVLGVAGLPNVGKDTFADVAKEMGFKVFAFADPLKAAASVIFRVPLEVFYDTELKEELLPEWDLTPREILHRLGTEVGREFREDLWVKRLFMDVADYLAQGGARVLIPDVRYENEAEGVRDAGGGLVHIIRPNGPKTTNMGHSSNNGVKFGPEDVALINDSPSVEAYRFKAGELLTQIINS